MSMRLPGLFFFLLLCAIAQAQNPNGSDYVKQHYDKREVYIPMRDGVRLFTAIYTPKDKSTLYPILMCRTPYSVSPYGEDQYRESIGPSPALEKEGYIIVYQDVRGRMMSEGNYEDIRPHNPAKKKKEIDESSDTYDTVDWLLRNVAGNNGKVGMWGISYPGFYCSAALPGAHAALKAVSPQAPVTDWFIGDDFHHNGALMLMDAFSFYSSFGRPRPAPTTSWKPGYVFPHQDNYRFFLEMGPLANAKKLWFGDSIQFWNDLMSHPDYDDFWKARNIRSHLKGIQPAVLTVGGFFDAEDCFGAIQTYAALEKQNPGMNNRVVLGPWIHGGWARGSGEKLGDISFGSAISTYYQKQIEAPFFNYHLKGKGSEPKTEASVFFSGSNDWKSYPAWPPAPGRKRRYYLQSGGKLSETKTTGTAPSYSQYVSDPARPVPYEPHIHLKRTREYMINDQRFAARRPDVLVFESEALQNDVRAAGPITADLFVSTSGTDADFIVKVIDVYPDTASDPQPNPGNVHMGGYQMLVRGEVMRGRYRNSFEKPEPFVTDQATPLRLELPDVGHTFRAGHKIMIQVQSTWFPLVDRNPQTFVNIYQAGEKDFRAATQRVYHQADMPSSVTLTLAE